MRGLNYNLTRPHPKVPLQKANLQKVPQSILARRMVKKRNVAATQVLVKWENQAEEDATWENYDEIAAQFSEFFREDMNRVKEGGVLQEATDLGVTVGVDLEGGEEGNLVSKGKGKGKGARQLLLIEGVSISAMTKGAQIDTTGEDGRLKKWRSP